MDPRTDYESGEPVTTRAYVTMFRKVGDQFQFAVDGGVSDEEEVRSYLLTSDNQHGGSTTIGVTAINEKERFETIRDTLGQMGLTILEEDETEEYHEEIGEYTAYTLDATAPIGLEAEWNVPHLIVYGSLSPEVEEACYAAFGTGDEVNFTNIRNHFVVYGAGVTEDAKTKLATAVQQSNEFFDDHQRDVVSSVNTADFV